MNTYLILCLFMPGALGMECRETIDSIDRVTTIRKSAVKKVPAATGFSKSRFLALEVKDACAAKMHHDNF